MKHDEANVMVTIKWNRRDWLVQLAHDLTNFPREGADEDVPEGARYLYISDTLAIEIANRLRDIAYDGLD